MNYQFKWRVIEPWSEPDGVNFFSPSKSILSWDDMKNFTPGSRTVKFVQDCKKWGYNAMGIFMDPEDNIEASRSFATHLKKNGIGMLIRRNWTELEGKKSWPVNAGSVIQRTSKKLCPYSENTREYWEKRIAEDYRNMPDILGYRMNGTAYVFINGAPWMCDCEECKKHTERERSRDAIRLVSSILAKYGGILFWETCQDDPNGQDKEAVYFDKMTGQIPENAYMVIKAHYWDFHPGYPRHPLFDTITKDKDGKSPYLTSIQLAGEYRGVHKIPYSMVDEWSSVIKDMVCTGQAGLWVMAIVGYNDWDHPLNMVNWYAISRFVKEPDILPEKIKNDWATENFGSEAADTVVKVIDRMTSAAKAIMEFKGLWTQNHSRYPHLEYIDMRLFGPCRQSPMIKGMMGHQWPLSMYLPEREEEIRKDDNVRLCFKKEPLTEELKVEMMSEKKQAIDLVRESVSLWKTLEGKIEQKIYKKVLNMLRGNIDDAILWYVGFDMYMDMKLGKLTEEKIDSILQECKEKNLKGTIVDDPLDPEPVQTDCCHEPSSLKTFAEELRREIKEPYLEEAINNIDENDTGDLAWEVKSSEE